MPGDELILEIIEGPSTGRQIPVSGAVELGREPRLDATIDDEQLSRRHARVAPSDRGAVIEDLGSLNGTYVNDQLVQGPHQLAAGDRVRIGLTVLELRAAEAFSVQRSAVEPAPEITALGRDVLEVVPEEELAPVQPETPNLPGFLAEESEPAYIQQRASAGSTPQRPGEHSGNPDAIARLVDVRVKHQTNTAAFAFLAVAAMAVLIYFGVR